MASIFICLFLIVALVITPSAATLSEMRENGEVSDGGIIHHSPRDGEISDVTDNGDGLVPEISSVIDDGLGIGPSDTVPGTTDAPFMSENGSTVPETTRVTSSSTAPSPTTNGTAENGGMSAGLIIAILVVVAVVVIIFILLPKKR